MCKVSYHSSLKAGEGETSPRRMQPYKICCHPRSSKWDWSPYLCQKRDANINQEPIRQLQSLTRLVCACEMGELKVQTNPNFKCGRVPSYRQTHILLAQENSCLGQKERTGGARIPDLNSTVQHRTVQLIG